MENVDKLPEILENQLLEIVKRVSKEYNVQVYLDNPDFLEDRISAWHQFGLISHTKKVREIYLNKLKEFLRKWDISNLIEHFDEEIKDVKKSVLFEISIVLHDLGKIPCYGDSRVDREHEILSGKIIKEDFLNNKLKDFGLLEEHINYIKKCVETHDILGKELRDKLKHENKLNLDFLNNRDVIEMCKYLYLKYEDFKTEIGIFFLCDLLGKTDIIIDVENDQDILNKEKDIEDILKKRNLPVNLKKAVMQLPMTIKLAEVYLKNL
ncbi:MAG: hypothetical protein ABIH37_02300 [archaeon]